MIKSLNRMVYGPTAEERVREWQSKLRAKQRELDKDMRQVRPLRHCALASLTVFWRQLDVAAKRTKQQVKQCATKGDVKSARILAREVIRANRQVDRMSVSKAQLGSINSQLQQQLGPSARALLRVGRNTHARPQPWPRSPALCRNRRRS
jgi:charged multivesicular body protein 3